MAEERVVTTAEVGSWMDDLGARFAEIIEDRSGVAVRAAAVDEKGRKWTTARIEQITGIPNQTVGRMVRKARSQGRTLRARSEQPAAKAARMVTTAAEQEELIRAIAKKNPEAVLNVALEQQGQTRRTSPSTKARVEQAFGPEEFNRFEDAIDALLERLPDLAPNGEDRKYARDLAAKAEATAEMLRSWAQGKDIGSEVEEWLEAR